MNNKNSGLFNGPRGESVKYVLVGIVTSAVNLATFYGLLYIGNFNYLLSNTAAWVLTVIVAYFGDKILVFKTPFGTGGQIAKEFFRFVYSRCFSCVVDMILLWFLVEILKVPAQIAKIINSGVVVFINYVFAKALVFNDKLHKGRQ